MAQKATIEQILTDMENGMTYRQIADKYGYGSGESVRTIVKKHRREEKRREHEEFASESLHEPTIDKEQEFDKLVVNIDGAGIKTKEEFMEAAEIDEDEYTIRKLTIKKWSVPVKKIDKVDNKQTTTILRVAQWAVGAELYPKDPKHTLLPVLVIAARIPEFTGKTKLAPDLVAIYGDTHFDFLKTRQGRKFMHDRRVLKIMRMIMDDYGIGESIHLGDLFDFAEHSKNFAKTPEFLFTTQAAMIEASYWLSVLQTKHVVEGNHDVRIRHAVNDHYMNVGYLTQVNDLDGEPVTSIPHLMQFEEAGITWYEKGYEPKKLTDKAYILHGDATYNAEKMWTLYPSSRTTFFGHLHKPMSFMKADSNEEVGVRQSHGIGCCCNVDGTVPGHKTVQGWIQGFGIYDKASNRFEHVIVENGEAYFRGKMYVADNDMQDEVIAGKLDRILA